MELKDDQWKNQDGQLQGWLGVLNRVGIPTPLPAGYGSVCTERELHIRRIAKDLDWEGGMF